MSLPRWLGKWIIKAYSRPTFLTHSLNTGLKISVPKWPGKWVVGMDEYKDGVVGAKSKNLAGLRGKLPDWIALPPSVTLPFGCFEEVRVLVCASVCACVKYVCSYLCVRVLIYER